MGTTLEFPDNRKGGSSRISTQTDPSPFSDKILLIGFAVYILWIPLPFASVTPWAVLVLETGAFILLSSALLVHSRDRYAPKSPRQFRMWTLWIPATALAGIALLGCVQAVPWPRRLVAFLSPTHASLFERAESLAASAGAGSGAGIPMSLGSSQSLAASLFLFSIACLFVASAILCRDRKIRRRLTWVMAAAAAFQILYGTVSFQGGTIWGVAVPHDPFRLRGTFVNPNHFAMYLEICWAVTIAWTWRAWTRSGREHLLDRRVLKVAPLVLFMLLIFAALAFSGSRTGLLAALAALTAQGLLIAMTLRRWRFGIAGAAILAVACTGLVAVVGFQRGLGRFLATSPYEVRMNQRLIGYKATLELWQDFKLFGTGLGTFGEAFPMVQPEELTLVWRHAHNDYLELLATTGILGFAILCSGLFFFARGHWRALRHGERSEDLAVSLAVLGVTTVVAIHSCFDFGLTIPANAASLAIVCGAGAGVAIHEVGS